MTAYQREMDVEGLQPYESCLLKSSTDILLCWQASLELDNPSVALVADEISRPARLVT